MVDFRLLKVLRSIFLCTAGKICCLGFLGSQDAYLCLINGAAQVSAEPRVRVAGCVQGSGAESANRCANLMSQRPSPSSHECLCLAEDRPRRLPQTTPWIRRLLVRSPHGFVTRRLSFEGDPGWYALRPWRFPIPQLLRGGYSGTGYLLRHSPSPQTCW